MTRKGWIIWLISWFLVLTISVVWHFPASYLGSLPAVQKALPPSLTFSQIQGPWWGGTTSVVWQQKSLGQVRWQWQPMALLKGRLGLDLSWQYTGQRLALLFHTDGENLEISGLSGQVKLGFLSQLSPNLALLNEALGEVILKDIFLRSTLKNPWPTAISGKLVVIDLSAMGVAISTAEVIPSLQEQTLVLNTIAKDKGWRLTGKTLLNSPNRFSHDYQLSAENAKSMPDWTALFMRQTSPTQAILKGSGTW